jgi:hypothetical protein
VNEPLRNAVRPLVESLAEAKRRGEMVEHERLSRMLVDRLYAAADLIEDHERTIATLFALAEDAIAMIDRYDPAAPARAGRSLRSDLAALRAKRLKAEGLTAPAIGLRMAREDGRPDDPYDARQVRRWLDRPTKNGTD